jgi:Leucine-rich repeat (LRR) protein
LVCALFVQISRLSRLQILDLSRNSSLELSTIDFGRLESLHTLRLCGLKLAAIPNDVYNLRNLRVASFEGNLIQELDGSAMAESWTHLEELDISNNNISKLPTELAKLKLRALSWSGNPLVAPNRAIANRGTEAILAWLVTRT